MAKEKLNIRGVAEKLEEGMTVKEIKEQFEVSQRVLQVGAGIYVQSKNKSTKDLADQCDLTEAEIMKKKGIKY